MKRVDQSYGLKRAWTDRQQTTFDMTTLYRAVQINCGSSWIWAQLFPRFENPAKSKRKTPFPHENDIIIFSIKTNICFLIYLSVSVLF